MVLDRRKTIEIAQALLRARNQTDENVVQTGMASGDRSYGGPAFDGVRLSSADEDVDKAKARGIPAHGQLVFKAAPSALSRSEDLQAIRGQPLEVNGAHSTDSKPTSGYAVNKAFGLTKSPATDAAGARAVESATQTDFGGAGTYQSPEHTKSEFNNPRVAIDALRHPLWNRDGTVKSDPRGDPAAILRMADVESGMAKEALREEREMPEIRYPTSDEIWWEFWGGIGKGLAQAFSDTVVNGARARLATRGGVYVPLEYPDLFGPPTRPWDDTGRKLAPAIAVVTRPLPPRPKTWNGKIIGTVKPPTHLKPGTGPFGDYMHEKIVEFLQESYPHTKFYTSIKRGQNGVDMRYESGLKPSSYIDIKPNNPHSQKHLKRQIQNWGYEESEVRPFTYDEYGNIYDGFGK